MDTIDSTIAANAFTPIANVNSEMECFASDMDATPTPNPLVERLKIIDEKEGRNLKNKSSSSLEPPHGSKKKSKGGGGRKSPK